MNVKEHVLIEMACGENKQCFKIQSPKEHYKIGTEGTRISQKIEVESSVREE